MRPYTTLAGAKRAAHGRPIIRLLADPVELFVIVPSLSTQIHVLTANGPNATHRFAGSIEAMAIIGSEMKGNSNG